MAEPTVAAGIARGLIQFAVSKGASQNLLVARTEVKLEKLENPDTRIPFATYVALMKRVRSYAVTRLLRCTSPNRSTFQRCRWWGC